jgi:hypothetical protein
MNATLTTTQQQEPVARNPDGPKTKTGQGTSTDRFISKMINNFVTDKEFKENK